MGSRDQDAVAAARNWREGWRGIIYLVEQGHSPIDVSAPSKAISQEASHQAESELSEIRRLSSSASRSVSRYSATSRFR